MDTEKSQGIYFVISKIPYGSVTSYGRIASQIPGVTARMVARALRNLPTDSNLPWFRVVSSNLKTANFSGSEHQVSTLKLEGVTFSASGKINIKHLWDGSTSL